MGGSGALNSALNSAGALGQGPVSLSVLPTSLKGKGKGAPYGKGGLSGMDYEQHVEIETGKI